MHSEAYLSSEVKHASASRTYRALVDEAPKLVGDRIRARREELGMKPVDLSRAAGCSISAVLQWESNKTKNLRPENLFKISDALDVEARWLAIGEGPKQPHRELGLKLAIEEGEAIKRLRDGVAEWRNYVLSLAMIDRNQQDLFLKTMQQAVPDYKVEKAYGFPGKAKHQG